MNTVNDPKLNVQIVETLEMQTNLEDIKDYTRPFGITIQYRDALDKDSEWQTHKYVDESKYVEDIDWQDADLSDVTNLECIDIKLESIEEISK